MGFIGLEFFKDFENLIQDSEVVGLAHIEREWEVSWEIDPIKIFLQLIYEVDIGLSFSRFLVKQILKIALFDRQYLVIFDPLIAGKLEY